MTTIHSRTNMKTVRCEGFPGGLTVKNPPANTGFGPWSRKIPYPQSNQAHVPQLLEPSPHPEPMLQNKKNPTHHNEE